MLSQDDSFFGTDFSYDDFGGPSNLDDYSFKILREEVMDGNPCYVVEVTPKIRRKFTRYVAWVARDLWIQVRVEYYRDKALYREGSFTDVRMIGDIPTCFKGALVLIGLLLPSAAHLRAAADLSLSGKLTLDCVSALDQDSPREDPSLTARIKTDWRKSQCIFIHGLKAGGMEQCAARTGITRS